MKIALISVQYTGTVTGGGGIHVINLSRELTRQGFDVTILCMGINDLPESESRKIGNKTLSVRRFWTSDSRFLDNPFEGSKAEEIRRLEEFKKHVLTFLLKNQEFDVIHLHGHFIIPSLAKDLKKVNYPAKIVTTFHAFESISEREKGSFSKTVYEYIVRREREALLYSDIVILLSKFLIRGLYKIHGDILENVNIKIIPNGVDPILIQYEKMMPDITRFRNEISSDYLLFNLNRIDPSKKIEFLLWSLPKIKDRFSDKKIFLLVAGKLEDRNKLYKKRLTELSTQLMNNLSGLTIRIMENISDNQKILYYDASDVFITVSPIEPFGMTILESIVRETPVVVVDAPGPREIFGIDYSIDSPFIETPAGVIVKFGDEKEVIDNLAVAVSHLLENLPKFRSGVKKYKQKVLSTYTWETIVNSLSQIYRDP